jgi:hypothetical protein
MPSFYLCAHPPTLLPACLQREDELRLSSEAQQQYAAAELREDVDWMEVTDGLQRRVLREEGIAEEHLEHALRAMRAAPYKWVVPPWVVGPCWLFM